MVVQHNLTAMNSNRMLGITQGSLSKSAEKLSSGYKVNRAADDAAGLSISEKMRKQIRGLEQASLNAEDGISAVQTAEGALTEVHDMLQRMNELAVKASNGTNSADDRQTIQDEVDQLLTEIDRVAETTKFNETYLLKGDTNPSKDTMRVAAHDAGIKGTLVDGATTATFTMAELKAGDTITIAGKEYSIGDTADNVESAILGDNRTELAVGEKLTIDGIEYTIGAADDEEHNILESGNALDKIKAGTTVKYNGTTYHAIDDQDNDNVDDNNDSVINATKAYDLINAELKTASSIGATTAATVATGTAADDKISFTITKGSVQVQKDLNFSLHVGADADMTNKINVGIEAMDTTSLGIKGLNVKDETGTAATYAVDAIADAVAKVSAQRSKLGAVQNRLEHTIKNLDNIVENTTAAESQIRDTDMASEMVQYSNANILSQAGQSMLAQANQSNQGVLGLLG